MTVTVTVTGRCDVLTPSAPGRLLPVPSPRLQNCPLCSLALWDGRGPEDSLTSSLQCPELCHVATLDGFSTMSEAQASPVRAAVLRPAVPVFEACVLQSVTSPVRHSGWLGRVLLSYARLRCGASLPKQGRKLRRGCPAPRPSPPSTELILAGSSADSKDGTPGFQDHPPGAVCPRGKRLLWPQFPFQKRAECLSSPSRGVVCG